MTGDSMPQTMHETDELERMNLDPSHPTISALEMSSQSHRSQSWRQLLIDTERGMAAGMRGDSAVFAQLFLSSVVLTGAFILDLNLGQWSVIILALTTLLAMVFVQQGLKILLRLLACDYPCETRLISRIITAAMSIMWLGSLCSIGVIFYQRLTHALGWE
ncbi:MAG: hypothetical protein ACKVT0_21175 [Planctomycetaceae bacterium]